MLAFAAELSLANRVWPPFRLLMLADAALLLSKKDVVPPLLMIVASPAVVSAWKIVSPPVSRLVIVALPAVAVSLPPEMPKIVAPPLRFVRLACPAVLWSKK